MKLIFSIALLLALLVTACDEKPTVVIPESSEDTEKALRAVSEVISTFDISEDFTSTSDFFLRKEQSFLPADAKITLIDGDFTDGNGIEAVIDFGATGIEPYGLLCKDNKYRSGKIYLSLNKPYNELDAKLTLRCDNDDAFYSGNGKEMAAIKGEIQIQRISKDELKLNCSGLSVKFNENENVVLAAKLSIICLEKMGVSLLNDKLSFSGVMTMATENAQLTFKIVEPLQKHYELNCAQFIKKGKVDVETNRSVSEIAVDFDPNKDGACDHVVSITANGRTFIYSY